MKRKEESDLNSGRLIRELRLKAGYTQRSLSEALRVTDKAISKWERDICLPDISLLPKLALLFDVDMEILISKSLEQDEWIGVIDIENIDFSQSVYDKPLVYYLLSHFLLLGVTNIHVLTNERNQEYLKSLSFRMFGLNFHFNVPEKGNYMVITHPWFLFGSDLTQQFQGAMISRRPIKLVPDNQPPVFFFSYNCEKYEKKKLQKMATTRTLGRGMICFNMDDYDNVFDVASFVKTYQKNSNLLIGSLEEIAYRRGIISSKQLLSIAETVPYGEILRNMVSKPQVG